MTFTGEYKWDIVTGSVVFISKDAGKRLVHQVSEEALKDYFGFDGPAEQSGGTFVTERGEIERLAEVAASEGQINTFGGANITSEWLTKNRYHRRRLVGAV